MSVILLSQAIEEACREEWGSKDKDTFCLTTKSIGSWLSWKSAILWHYYLNGDYQGTEGTSQFYSLFYSTHSLSHISSILSRGLSVVFNRRFNKWVSPAHHRTHLKGGQKWKRKVVWYFQFTTVWPNNTSRWSRAKWSIRTTRLRLFHHCAISLFREGIQPSKGSYRHVWCFSTPICFSEYTYILGANAFSLVVG